MHVALNTLRALLNTARPHHACYVQAATLVTAAAVDALRSKLASEQADDWRGALPLACLASACASGVLAAACTLAV